MGTIGSAPDKCYTDLNPSPEAAIALRQRLNETVEQLDELRRKHAELEVNFENQSKELTIAKSDRKL
jgi:protein HOOK3